MSSLDHVWIDVTELPSGFKPYPQGTTVRIRPYTYRETKVLSDESLSNSKRDLLISKGIESSVPVSSLSYLDFVYLSATRVLLSSEDPKFKYKDELFSISDVIFSEIKATTLPATHEGLSLTLPTVEKSLKNDFPALDDEERTIFMFVDASTEEVEEILNSWTYDKIRSLIEFIHTNLVYGYSVNYKGTEEKIDLSVLTPFS